jgi:hypothetical protein
MISSNPIREHFRDGSFSAIIVPTSDRRGLLAEKTMQFVELTNVVEIPLGHRTRELLEGGQVASLDIESVIDTLGFHVNAMLISRMAKKAADFAANSGVPELEPAATIVHHPNNRIGQYINSLPIMKRLNTVDMSEFGNCGAATVGIGFAKHFQALQGKRVAISSFGTGGVITCGCWQL